ncbi:hypothetical protein L596_009678 [Steinernema carpocapsae]|uniref:NADH dehydrogenase [ubiquinone] 1 beta subcomplex subunit 3 n=1 Tax=Steinernema carpocapsae TaxID=34508 RepID=A0A4U5PG86_STECR|nr:hypothetical protein L596_009678 [Steinernema carpocapsae]
MGHGHHEPFEVPKYTVYGNYQEFPELAAHQRRLQKIGLKDPWIRNYTYLYDRQYPHVKGQWAHFKDIILRGWKPGVAVAAGLIAVEEAYSFVKHGHTSWASHH